MTIKSVLVEMLVTFTAAFVTSALVTLLWNSVRHKTAVVNWDTVFILAITLGIILPLAGRMKKKE